MPTNTASQRKSVHHPKAPAGNDHSRAHHPPAPAGNDHSRPAHRSDDTLFADDERRKRARVEDSSDGRHDDDDDEDEDEEEDEEEVSTPEEIAEHYRRAARWICRSISPFLELKELLVVIKALKVRRNKNSLSLGKARKNEKILKGFHEADLPSYEAVYKYLDDLSQERDDLRSYFLNSINDVDKRVAFLSLIHIGYRTARSADTGILKLQILGLMCEEEDEDLKKNLINKGKEARGYAHPQVCELLLPAEMAVKDDPAIREKARLGELTFTHKHFPAFMFDMAKYKKNAPLKGLFEGFLLLRVARCLLIAPSAGIKRSEMKTSRTGNAALHACQRITPEIIAYIASQTYVALSTHRQWKADYGDWNLREFHRDIIEFFDGVNKNWEEHVLKLWTEEVFGGPKVENRGKEPSLTGLGTLDLFKAQWQAEVFTNEPLEPEDDGLAPRADGVEPEDEPAEPEDEPAEPEDDPQAIGPVNNYFEQEDESLEPDFGLFESEDEIGTNLPQTPPLFPNKRLPFSARNTSVPPIATATLSELKKAARRVFIEPVLSQTQEESQTDPFPLLSPPPRSFTSAKRVNQSLTKQGKAKKTSKKTR